MGINNLFSTKQGKKSSSRITTNIIKDICLNVEGFNILTWNKKKLLVILEIKDTQSLSFWTKMRVRLVF